MSAPWPYGPKKFTVPRGQASLIQLNVPQRGTLRAFRLLAADTNNDGASFIIYNNQEAAALMVNTVNGSAGSNSLLDDGSSPRSSQVIEGSLTDGEYSENALLVAYCNNDGGPSNREGRLWMCLNVAPGAGGDADFTISMTIEGPDF